MPRYKLNGKTYNIPNERVEGFLTKFGTAEPIDINSFNETEDIDKKEKEVVVPKVQESKKAEIFEPLKKDIGLSNTNQGAFGYQANYFTPKPLQPELNIEQYDIESKEKEYKIDTEEEEEKARKRLGLNQSKLLENMETLPPTKDEAIKINAEANLLFPVGEDGNYKISNLNPDNLITQEEFDEGVTRTAGAVGRMKGGVLGEGLAKGVSNVFSKGIEFWERNFGDEKIGDKKLLNEESQSQITSQIEFVEQAEKQLQAQLKKGDITKEEANDPNKIAKLAKSLYINDKELDVYRKNLTKFLDEDVDKSWFNLSKPELQKDLEQLYDVHKSSLDKATKNSLNDTKVASLALQEIANDFNSLKIQAEKMNTFYAK